MKKTILIFLIIPALWGCGGDETPPVTPDTTAPKVVSTIPADGATNVPIGTNISATFSEEMDRFSFSLTSVMVSGGVSGTLLFSGKSITLMPSSELLYENSYTVTIDTAVTDVAGNHLDSVYSWSFTITAGDIMPLAVGNKWEMVSVTYDTLSSDSVVSLAIIEIVSDTTIGSDTWYISQTGQLFTNKADGLWSMSDSGQPFLFLKFPAVAGDFYPANLDLGEAINVVSTSVLVGVPHGNHICYYYLSTVSDPAFKYRYYYRPNLGPVVHEKVTGTSLKIVERKSLKSVTLN